MECESTLSNTGAGPRSSTTVYNVIVGDVVVIRAVEWARAKRHFYDLAAPAEQFLDRARDKPPDREGAMCDFMTRLLPAFQVRRNPTAAENLRKSFRPPRAAQSCRYTWAYR